MKFSFKKCFAAFALLTVSAALFAQSYGRSLASAKNSESNGKYFAALSSYYDAMMADQSERGADARNGFTRIANSFLSGNLGNDSVSVTEDKWISVLVEYEKYLASNFSMGLYFSDFSKGTVNYSSKTANYNFYIGYAGNPKAFVLAWILASGYETASTVNSFRNADYVSNGTIRTGSGFLVEGVPYCQNSDGVFYSSLLPAGTELIYNIVDDSGNVLYKDLSVVLTDTVTEVEIKNVEKTNMALLDSGSAKVVLTGCKLHYGNCSRTPVTNLQFIAGDVSKIKCMYDQDEFEAYANVFVDLIAELSSNRSRPATSAAIAALISKKTVNRYNFEMVKVQGGSFVMGSNDGDDDELPMHNVTLSTFEMLRTEVTQGLYAAVMDDHPYYGYGVGNNYPVYNVSWYDAIVFCNYLSIKSGLTPCYSVNGQTDPARWNYTCHDDDYISGTVECNFNANGYRLPTEAEWEYAARGGVYGKQNDGSSVYAGRTDYYDYGEIGWYEDNANDTVQEVALLEPNELGLYDMSGNVYELCWDYYDEDYYDYSASSNPTGGSGDSRIARGGSAYSSRKPISYRYLYDEYETSSYLGFRVVRSLR